MKNYPIVEKQITKLIEMGLEVDDKDQLSRFLNRYPYQNTIKQVNYVLLKKCDKTKYNIKSSELIHEYNALNDSSFELLKSTIAIEKEIKNQVFIILLEVYNSDKSLYKNLIGDIIKKTTSSSKYLKIGREDGESSNEDLINFYEEKIYKVINGCFLRELVEVLEIIPESYRKKLYDMMSNKLEISNKYIYSTLKTIDVDKFCEYEIKHIDEICVN